MNSCWQRLSGKMLTLSSTSDHEERSMFQKEEAEILNYFTWAAFPRTETGTRSAHLSCKCPLVWSPFVGIASRFSFRSLDLRYWQKPSQFRNLSPILTSLIFLLHSSLGYILTASHLGLCFSSTKSVEVWARDSLCPKISHQDLPWFSHVCAYVCGKPQQLTSGVNESRRNHTSLVHSRVSHKGDFPGSPVVKTPCFQHKGCRFNPWLGK